MLPTSEGQLLRENHHTSGDISLETHVLSRQNNVLAQDNALNDKEILFSEQTVTSKS